MRVSKRHFAIAALFALVSVSQAWIDTGHMIIAAIALRDMKPSVKAECDRLLKIGADDRNTDFITTAPWADDVRGQRRNTGPWHYIDLHFRSDGKPDSNQPDAENVVWAIHKFSTVLKDKSQPDAARSEALRFLIHFVGDIHQPLHCTARDSDAEPNGDKGGNDFHILTPDVFNGDNRPPRNLHALWDFGGGLFKGERRPLSAEARIRIEGEATMLTKQYPPRSLRGLNDMKPEDWAKEGLALDKSFIYNLQEGSKPSEAYVKKAQAISAERVTMAGYRLAKLLNELLK